jgi:TRAP transporter TAXI family solute receptor
MKRRLAGWSAAGLGSVFALALIVTLGLGSEAGWAQRVFFIIATGPTSGTYFPVGEALAGLISHPPGLHRCDDARVCGPTGLIASARTSTGAMANVIDVNAHRVNSGLAQADVVAEAVAGRGAFKKIGPQSHVRVIADLFPEDLHLVAAKRAHIASVYQLKGKHVSLGAAGSGTSVTAHAVLAAYRIATWRIKGEALPSDVAADALEKGKLDAFFFVGGAPVGLVRDLIAHGHAVLVPIDGVGRKRLLARVPSLRAASIPAGTYRGVQKIETVDVRALWVVNDAEPGDLVYAVTRALFNPANRALLDQSHPSARLIRLDTATVELPAPLHPGAARFYREVGRLPAVPVPMRPPDHRS